MGELVAERVDGWTFDDLKQLLRPGQRIEIVDGSIMMSPSPGFRHEVVAERLRRALGAVLPDRLLPIGPIGVTMGASVPEPDIVVVDAEGEDRPRLTPSEVVIAIEIVSASSRTTDRITKPALYAQAGIPAYWRVEIDPEVSITAYVLRDGDVYTELGTWHEGATMRLSEPFAVEIAIDDLTRARR